MSAWTPILPTRPHDLDDWQPVILSVSGGKDSTATILVLREMGISVRYVFADTGWEADETYEYLDLLRSRLGIEIHVVRAKMNMVEHILAEARFPSGVQRWCTRDLKIKPLRAFHDEVAAQHDISPDDTVSVVGIRAAESDSRRNLKDWEYVPRGDKKEPGWGGFVWRPIIGWSVEDVLHMHHRHNIPVNPLYLDGLDRVGCYPCVFENKEGIRVIANRSPDRIDLVGMLERSVTALRAQRNLEQPGRYEIERASFFLSEHPTIYDVVEWAKTDRGGRQYPLLQPPPRGGCMRWGLCEHPEAYGNSRRDQ